MGGIYGSHLNEGTDEENLVPWETPSGVGRCTGKVGGRVLILNCRRTGIQKRFGKSRILYSLIGSGASPMKSFLSSPVSAEWESGLCRDLGGWPGGFPVGGTAAPFTHLTPSRALICDSIAFFCKFDSKAFKCYTGVAFKSSFLKRRE